MIDFQNIENYRENNRIEAKRASGGLPESIWETYSAFANTLGGVILLGVAEASDKSLYPIDLPDPESLVEEFWRMVNDEHVVSANILSRDDVAILTVEGNRIVAITVPPAPADKMPVFIGRDVFSGSYRRSGEGDYKFSGAEVEIMLSDK
jgi:predicted HTH transcriptional regulator